MMAQMDKAFAWWAAKNYAQIYPEELAEMPAKLTESMLSQQKK